MSDQESDNRLTGFESASSTSKPNASKTYSRVIRILRIAFPIIAILIIAMIFAWPNMEKTIAPLAQDMTMPELQSAQNQLVEARYESIDGDKQPFTITSDKAVQDPNNPMLVNLEKPTADLLLKDGAWIAANADSAIYEQNTEKLTLKGNVRIFHDAGYQLESEEMLINVSTQDALSNQDVYAHGPEGTIKGRGMEASGTNNIIIFNGPAKMTLYTSDSLLDIGGTTP